MKNFKKIICLLLVLFTLLTSNLGCAIREYGYFVHFYVDGEGGDIMIETSQSFNPNIYLCTENPMCELNCPPNSYLFYFRGGKTGCRVVNFIANPNDGYKVKEWEFNGKIIDNDTNYCSVCVSNDNDYNSVLVLRFDKI